MQGSGTMGGEALAGSDLAFALGGTLNLDLERQKIFAQGLEITGSVDGDGLPFRFIADLDLSQPARTLTATGMRLTLRDWQFDGTMTVRAARVTVRGAGGTRPAGSRSTVGRKLRDHRILAELRRSRRAF